VLLICLAAASLAIEIPQPRARQPRADPNTIYANNSAIWYSGRTRINSDGSRDFDWEATQIWVNIQNAWDVKIDISGAGIYSANLMVEVNGWFTTSIWVNTNNPGPYPIAPPLGGGGTNWNIRVFNNLEPAFCNESPEQYLHFVGFITDGQAATPSPPRSRRIEIVGDSITAGFGARGFSNPPFPCQVNMITSGNYYTYNHFICENFTADCTTLAWSGKGMYENCCDNGETMPAYYLQTLGGESYSRDWDFTRWAPNAMIINLGTNDFGHDSGPAWVALFVATYVAFVQNATKLYNNPTLPVFVAQGPMNDGAPLNDALTTVISQLTAAGNKAYFLDLRGPPNDGCGGHPGVQGHRQMADMAIPQIAKVMGW